MGRDYPKTRIENKPLSRLARCELAAGAPRGRILDFHSLPVVVYSHPPWKK
jgi:hypothetical protein